MYKYEFTSLTPSYLCKNLSSNPQHPCFTKSKGTKITQQWWEAKIFRDGPIRDPSCFYLKVFVYNHWITASYDNACFIVRIMSSRSLGSCTMMLPCCFSMMPSIGSCLMCYRTDNTYVMQSVTSSRLHGFGLSPPLQMHYVDQKLWKPLGSSVSWVPAEEGRAVEGWIDPLRLFLRLWCMEKGCAQQSSDSLGPGPWDFFTEALINEKETVLSIKPGLVIA